LCHPLIVRPGLEDPRHIAGLFLPLITPEPLLMVFILALYLGEILNHLQGLSSHSVIVACPLDTASDYSVKI
jgi:hypothetical protein